MDTRKEVALAESYGFEIHGDIREKVSFKKGNLRVWSIREGWQTSVILDNHHTAHKKFKNLEEALQRFDKSNG